ncbi:RsfA family transcriptional regulator, partial [Bacillus spizizenii]|nr:RsfA family transcriptional regulator [Bacillus spizizenii]
LRKQIGVHSVNMPNSVKQSAAAASEGKRDLSIQDVIQFLEQFKEA